MRAALFVYVCCALARAQAPADTVAMPAPAEAPATATAPAPAAPPPAPFIPPKWSDRRGVFFKRLFGPQAILETVPGTAFDTARNFPRQWGRTIRGTGQRLGSQYGQFAIGEVIEMGVSFLHKEDPRYFRMPDARFGRRLGHALASTVVVRGVDGTPTVAFSRLANVYGAWAIATTWNPPDQRSVGKIATYGTMGLSIKAASNVFREFWPDVKRRLAKH